MPAEWFSFHLSLNQNSVDLNAYIFIQLKEHTTDDTLSEVEVSKDLQVLCVSLIFFKSYRGHEECATPSRCGL